MEAKAEVGAKLVSSIQRAPFPFGRGFWVCVAAMRELMFSKSESCIGHERRERPLHNEEPTSLLTNLVFQRSDDLRHLGVWQCRNGTPKTWFFFAQETLRLTGVLVRGVTVGKNLELTSDEFPHAAIRRKNSIPYTFRRITNGILRRNRLDTFRKFIRGRMTQRGEI
jgi:hypothetical protein